MLDTLMASAPTRQGLGGWVSSNAVSITLHAAIISVAVFATMKPDIAEPVAIELASIPYVVRPPEKEAAPPQPVDALRPPLFETIVAPVHVPTGIPPVDSQVIFDPASFRGPAPDGVFDVLTDSGPTDASQVFITAVVDEPPVRISSPPLEYPSAMQRAGLEGVVVLQAIVDTTGGIEPGSLQVVQSDNVAFEMAAKRLIERSIFRPGRIRGRLVRVLIQIPVQFRLIDHRL